MIMFNAEQDLFLICIVSEGDSYSFQLDGDVQLSEVVHDSIVDPIIELEMEYK